MTKLSVCKECEREFSPELSEKPFSELREMSIDWTILSDANDPKFCSKWCEKKYYDGDDE